MSQICKFFQRGHCQYGERCRYSHGTTQQQKQNPFGFGQSNSQQQQQKPNPFGFGQNDSQQQQQKTNPFGFSQNNSQQQQNNNTINRFGVFNNADPKQQKPFENKWSRFSPIPAANSNQNQKPESKSQVTNHSCTNHEECKRIIAEDLRHERPLWKLTCYAHFKHLPCEIIGDVSYEELRASAYDDAKQGMSLQSIVEKERSLVNSMLIKFDNLLHNTPEISANSFSATNTSPSPILIQNSVAASTSLFGNPTNQFPINSQAAIPNTAFGQPSQFQFPSQIQPSNNNVTRPNPFQVSGQASNSSTGNMSFGTQVYVGGQQPTQTQGNAFSSNFGPTSNTNNYFPIPNVPSQFPSNANNSATFPSAGFHVAAITGNSHMDNKQPEGDMSIWLKENWDVGEIPEEEPPSFYCR